MNEQTAKALCEVGRALGADEITVCDARDGDLCSREPGKQADVNGRVLLPLEERKAKCFDCARGEDVLLVDRNGGLAGLTGLPGEWSHTYEYCWWKCRGVTPLKPR